MIDLFKIQREGMTVGEMIEWLQDFDKDKKVFIGVMGESIRGRAIEIQQSNEDVLDSSKEGVWIWSNNDKKKGSWI